MASEVRSGRSGSGVGVSSSCSSTAARPRWRRCETSFWRLVVWRIGRIGDCTPPRGRNSGESLETGDWLCGRIGDWMHSFPRRQLKASPRTWIHCPSSHHLSTAPCSDAAVLEHEISMQHHGLTFVCRHAHFHSSSCLLIISLLLLFVSPLPARTPWPIRANSQRRGPSSH